MRLKGIGCDRADRVRYEKTPRTPAAELDTMRIRMIDAAMEGD